MPLSITAYKVFIASPGGLDQEREAFQRTLQHYNESDAIPRGVLFIPVGWEATLPGFGRPQSLINDDLKECDYFVLTLWDRWGTPPSKEDSSYSSGTEEEYELAKELMLDANSPMRQIVAVFKAVGTRQLSDPGEQLQKVLAFRRHLETSKFLSRGL